MSRLGDLLKQERQRRKLSIKQAARMSGVSEQFLTSVEQGTRIIQDTEARRILKKLGAVHAIEQNFTLDDIAATIDLQTAETKEEKPKQTYNGETGVSGSIWLDALSAVLQKVPVYNAVFKQIDSKFIPKQDGKIEGYPADKLMYFQVPDDDMRGFRIIREDLVLLVKEQLFIDGAIMLVQENEHYMLRKIKKLDANNIMLQSFGREYESLVYEIDSIKAVAKAIKLEAKL